MNSLKKTLLILFGGKSGEYEVSLRSACAVIEAANRDHYHLGLLGITKDGAWYVYDGASDRIADGSWCEDTAHLAPATIGCDPVRGLLVLRDGAYEQIHIDVAFPVIHGQYGEDGRIQGLFECAGIPMVGCKTLASAICMDKAVTKYILSHDGIPMARHYLVQDGVESVDAAVAAVTRKIGYPCFVKPANSGSSVGASKAENADELRAALALAAQTDSKILIEEYVDAREVELAVLECEGKLVVSRSGEIDPGEQFYDYETKYVTDTARTYMPARITPECERELRTLAGKIFRALGCCGLSRVDFFVTREDERIVFNEINTMPGFTSISMYPKLFANEGLTFSRLIDILVTEAMRA